MFKTTAYVLFLLFIFSKVLFADPLSKEQSESIVPIVNAENIQNSISQNGLSAIFKMRLRQWQDGSSITVFVLEDDDPVHKRFCKEILNVFPHQMRRAWNKLVFSGSGQAPIKLESKEAMLEKIVSTPGAIGYMSKNNITGEIKSLEIQ